MPFRDTYVDYTRFPRVDEKLLYEDAPKAYEDAVRGVTEAEERDMWRYLNSIRDDVVYCVETNILRRVRAESSRRPPYAIFMIPVRWRGDVGSSLLDREMTW